jgi:lauroyl/myristoyl acyltransferase
MGQLRVCFGNAKSKAELRRIARRHFQFIEAHELSSVWPRLPSFSGADIGVSGLGHLDAALARGNGAVLLSFHLGYARLIKHVLASRGYTALLVGYAGPQSSRGPEPVGMKLAPPAGMLPRPRSFSRLEFLVRWRLLRFPSLGPRGMSDADIAAGINVRPVLAALAKNACVIVLADGAAAGSRVSSSVLGVNLPFAPGVFSVARASDAAVLPAFVVDDAKRVGARMRLEINPALELGDASSPAEGVRRFAAVLERYVERYPHMLRWTTRRFQRTSPEDVAEPPAARTAGP